MVKVKERKSESWKPGIHQDDGFISKNKKRKDKRMSLNLSAKKIDSDEFIPLKKTSLLPFNNAKKSNKENSKQTPNKLSTPANKQNQSPVKKENTPKFTPKGNKKDNSFVSTPVPRKLSLGKLNKTNTPKNIGTPNKKTDSVIKSSLKRKVEEYIDSEAEEGEEPITDKGPKPYVKGEKKKKKSISFKFNDQDKSDGESNDSADESDDADTDEESDEVTDGKGYIDEEASEGEETDDEDDEDDDDEDEDDDDSENDFDDFVVNDDAALDEEDTSDDDDSENEEDDESEKEEQKPQIKKQTPQIKKEAAPVKTIPEAKNAKTLPKKKSIQDIPVAKPLKNKVKEVQCEEENKPSEKASKPSSNFAGFAKYLPINTTEEEIKAQLKTVIKPGNIVSVVSKPNVKKNKINFLIYLSDEDSLEKLLNKTFTVRGASFKIYKARENSKVVKDKIVAFLPRVPLSVKDDKLKAAIEAEIGSGNIIEMKSKNHNDKFQTRNILITLPDEETLKKIVYKGSVVCDGVDVVIRQAFESACTIPLYKVVFSGIPEKTTEVLLKKTIESSVGKGSVLNVKFSFRKQSFAFVTLQSEEAQKKTLEVGNTISVKGTKLKVLEYKPRAPKKRSLRKNDKSTQNNNETSDAAKPKKQKNKRKAKSAKSDSPQKTDSPKNKKNKPNKAPTSNADKKANLKAKIEEKKKKIKQKKIKKESNPESD